MICLIAVAWILGNLKDLRYNLMGHFGANSHICQFAQKQGLKINDFSLKITWFQNFICKNYRKMTLFLHKNEGYHICAILGV